ncbi:MAG: hypothetical protein IJU20_00215 [Clostridia bacterium]|nr:hypothetical protein [Clostridia bacterium]
MKKRWVAFLLAMLFMALALASCKDKDNSPETESSAQNGGEETETEKETEPAKDENMEISFDDINIASFAWKYTGGLYEQNYTFVPIEGTTTTFQSSDSYMDSLALPADSVMVYGDTAQKFKAWNDSGKFTLDMMIPINRASKDYFESDKTRYEDIQMDASGHYLEHSTGGSYYMVPTDRWTEYIWNMLNRIAKSYHPDMIALEEPEMWHRSGYSEAFRRDWKLYYGEDWVDPASSSEAAFKAMRLKTYLFVRLLTDVSERMREKYPDIKLVIATHSNVNYNAWNITAGLNHYLALGVLDGVIGQTWSDTIHSSFRYAGKSMVDEYANAYTDYISYIDSVADSPLFYALADPASDHGYTYEEHKFMYRQTLAAQLMIPEVQRFEILPWSNRAFGSAAPEYKTIQMNMFTMLEDISGKDASLLAGTPGISYLLGDSVSWIAPGNGWALNSSNGVYGICQPLVYQGIPLKMKAMDQIKSKADLSNVTVLIVSYDNMLPDDSSVNEAIAEWVKAGGSLVVATGHNDYWNSASECWSKDGSPLQQLINDLGLKDTVRYGELYGIPMQTLKWTSDFEPDNPVADENLYYIYTDFALHFAGGEHVLAKVGDYNVAIEQSVGKGHVVFCGLPSAYYASSLSGASLIQALTQYAVQYTGYSYATTNLVQMKRGNYVILHALDKGEEVYGKYIDLYDSKLTVRDYVPIEAGDSRILLDISGLDLSVPRLAFAGATMAGEVKEDANETVFTFTSPTQMKVAARLLAPKGMYPESVKAESGSLNLTVEQAWSNGDSSLLLHIQGSVEPCTVTVRWGKTPVSDSYIGAVIRESVKTNNQNLDKDYLIKNTANANGNLRFCDNAGELIYRFDLKDKGQITYFFSVFQNYVVEISGDGENWTQIADYSQGGKVPHLTTGGNNVVIEVNPASWGFKDALYFKLYNARKNMGWGGSITEIAWEYPDPNDTGTEEPDPDLERTILPTRQENSESVITESAGEVCRRNVLCNQNGNDWGYLIYNTAGANSGVRYCDLTGELVYAFDLRNMKDALFNLTVAQNYIVEISQTGRDWELVADYNEGGTVPRIVGGGNSTVLSVRPEEYGFTECLYIRIRNTDTSFGFGGTIREIRWNYTAIADYVYYLT